MRWMWLLWFALALPAVAGPFADVPEDLWAADAVKRLNEAGILAGRADGLFHGTEPVSRYELAHALDKLRAEGASRGGGNGGGGLMDLLSLVPMILQGAGPLGDLLKGFFGANAKPTPSPDDMAAMVAKLTDAVMQLQAERAKAAGERLDKLAEKLQAEVEKLEGPAREQMLKALEDIKDDADALRAELSGPAREEVQKLLRDLLSPGKPMEEEAAPQVQAGADKPTGRAPAEGPAKQVLDLVRDVVLKAMLQGMQPAQQPAAPATR